MANKKISELVSRTPSLTDLMLVGDPSSGYSYKCTVHDIANIIESDIGDAYVTLTTTQSISGAKTFSNVLTLTSVANSSVDTDKFLVLTGTNTVNYRTGSEVLSDIGGASASSISGTTNYVAKFTSSSAVGNSIIFDNGTNVGISTTSPSYKLDVSGSLRSTTSSYFATGGGNIGIGTTGVTGIGGPILQIHASTYPEIHLTNSTTGDQYQDGTSIHVSGSSLNILNYESGSINLSTSGTQRVSIASDGNVTLSVIANATTDTDKFLVSDSGVIKYRTGAELLSDIGGQGALTLTTTGTSGAATLVGNTLNIPNYAPDLSGYVPTSRTLTINGTAYDLSANRTWSVGTVTSITGGTGLTGGTITGSGTLAFDTTWGDARYQLVLTNPVTGTGATNYIPKFTSSSAIGNSVIYESGGSIGIGTTSPDSKLHVLDAAGNSIRVGFLSGSANFNLYDASVHVFRNEGGSSERMRLDASGNLGIGTSSPSYKLDVNGNANVGTNLFVQSDALFYSRLRIQTTNSYYQAGTIGYNSVDGNYIWAKAGSSNNFTILNDGGSSILTFASTGAATFTSSVTAEGGVYSGNGLSATTMGGKNAAASGLNDKDLTLSAWYPTSGTNEYGGDLYLSAGRPTGGGSGKYGTVYIQAGIGNATSNVAGSVGTVISANNTLLQFFTASSPITSPTERMRITSGGDVGIGTTSPSATLHVNGTIKTAAPSGFTAKPWKLGDVTVTSITVDTDKYISVDINGTVYNIPTCHPN